MVVDPVLVVVIVVVTAAAVAVLAVAEVVDALSSMMLSVVNVEIHAKFHLNQLAYAQCSVVTVLKVKPAETVAIPEVEIAAETSDQDPTSEATVEVRMHVHLWVLQVQIPKKSSSS